jgi:lactate dehydrogenase-like 2-hydroxyacid dehydrogenase
MRQAIVSQLTDRFDAAAIERLEGVRSISNVAVGFDNIGVPAATGKGMSANARVSAKWLA